MNPSGNPHTFHIPVMGIGYSIDTAVRVAPYGISSVISLVDDILMEKMREFYSRKMDVPFKPITRKFKDFRSRRITSYLNLVDSMVKQKFSDVKDLVAGKREELERYIEMLPDFSTLKAEFRDLRASHASLEEIRAWAQQRLRPGSIDVNIMTKLDKENYHKGETLPPTFNDAHAALKGFAESNLDSSIVLSAGMNPRLYAYLESFGDFFPDAGGYMKKRITLKVSDYRSAVIQGKFLAKKGLWVSEYRIESGLNCGGHAFASDGQLMGPILESFRTSKQAMTAEIYDIWVKALAAKSRPVPAKAPQIRITAQGGVGTSGEQSFFIDYYGLDSVGWGSPFLLVPEAVAMDEDTRSQLCASMESDVYLSGISPLGVPFYSLRGNTKDLEKEELIRQGTPGSVCPKRYACINNEFEGKGLCTASRQYQELKIRQLDAMNVGPDDYREKYEAIVEKSCICVGLGTASLLSNGLNHTVEGPGVSVCPGPNIAYFSEKVSLDEMVGHIYGRNNVMKRTDRPHVFIKELGINIDYLKNRILPKLNPENPKDRGTLDTFRNNIREGIRYYRELFSGKLTEFQHKADSILAELGKKEAELDSLV